MTSKSHPNTARPKVVAASISKSRWAAYAAAGAASAIAGANSAEAAIHYSGTLNSVFNAGYSATVLRTFALDNNAVLRFAQVGSGSSNPREALFRNQGAAVSNQFRGVAVGNFRYPANLGLGVPLNGGAFAAFNGSFFGTLAFGPGYANSQFKTAGTGFIGFKFNGGAGSEFGWARVTVTGTPSNNFTLVDYAWADVGTSIVTGQTVATAVPEPRALGMLAAGAVGLLAWRRRRSPVAAATQNA